MLILTNALHILPNSEFGIFQGIRIVRLTCWINKHEASLLGDLLLIKNELHRRTAEDFLLKCLDSDQLEVVMGEVHEYI